MFYKLLKLSLYLLQHFLAFMISLINALNNHDVLLPAVLLEAVELIENFAGHLCDLGYLTKLLFVSACRR